MSELKAQLHNIFGREPKAMELKAFACFDPEAKDRKKRFRRYSESQPQFLNIDDEHYLYVSHHTNRLRCKLDMATRHLDTVLCYPHDRGSIMLGVTRPEKEPHLHSRQTKYRIFVQNARQIDEDLLHAASEHADHMALIQDESPWERLCRVCIDTGTGGHITASARRLFTDYESGILYVVPEHHNTAFKKISAGFELQPQFLGTSVPFPILSLDNEDGLLEIPLSTLRSLRDSMQRYRENRTPYREKAGKTPLPDIRPSYREQTDLLLDFLKKENEKDPSRNYKIPGNAPDLQIDPFPLRGLAFSENGIQLCVLSAIVNLYSRGLQPLALSYYMESTVSAPQKLDQLLEAMKKGAELFEVPIANHCIVPGDANRLKLFFVSRHRKKAVPRVFQDPGDFICLLGDPGGTIRGSAYAEALGYQSAFSPPGVMRGTIAAMINVLEECERKEILSSVNAIQRGGLFAALHRACGQSLGASVYSERKSPEQVFIFGEPQAALLVSIKEKNLIDLARITSNYNLTSTTIGRVREAGEININKVLHYRTGR